jgi:PAS domain S-box-containing protein
MHDLDACLPRYREAFARYIRADSELARESALDEATEIGKAVASREASIDDMRELHRRALQGLIERWQDAPAGAPEREALDRLIRGDAGPFGIAFMLPQELAQLRHHEQRWRREHGKLLALFQQTDDLIVVLDAQGQIESVNPAYTRVTGWSALEAATQMEAIWRGPLPQSTTRHARSDQKRRDGGLLRVEWSVSPILDDDGQLLSHVCIGRDITREQQIEEGLRENDKLRAVATLAGGIAHDFNNLLGSILGLAELCELEAVAASRQARNLGRIREAGGKAAALVRQLLDFSRETPKAIQHLSLSAVLSHAEGLLRAALPPQVVLLLSVEKDARVAVDLVQMEQVLLNLVRNAAQATGLFGGAVHIIVDQALPTAPRCDAPRAPHEPWARLRVIDHGAGIAPEHLPRIFDPFFTTKPVGEGTGLGLAAVHGIVSGHDGVVEVVSEPGIGTTFTVLLPQSAALADG